MVFFSLPASGRGEFLKIEGVVSELGARESVKKKKTHVWVGGGGGVGGPYLGYSVTGARRVGGGGGNKGGLQPSSTE